MGSCLGVIFALLIFAATGITLVYQWNTNSSMKFERVHGDTTEHIINE